jgi:hypothetical protein
VSGETYEIGEVAIYWRPISRRHNREVIIIGLPAFHTYYDTVTRQTRRARGYAISFGGEPAPYGNWMAEPHELRKRRPPQDWVRLCRLAERPVKEPG